MSTIYDKPGTRWNRMDTDDYFENYFKTNEMGDVVQQEKKTTKVKCFLNKLPRFMLYIKE
jgi:hypothetical protein